MLMQRGRAQLLVIDVQERLAPHVTGGDAVIANCRRLLAYAARLGVPATLTEHYPQGLGPTVPALLAMGGEPPPRLAKTAFSCWRDDAIRGRLEAFRARGRDQIVVAGMEAHVCVGQTVLDLLAATFHVYVVGDAVGSREAPVCDLAVARLRAAGADIVAQEMVAFEWLERGDDPAFKDLIGLIKS
jgi:nicotinamidase-related amidase